MSARRSAGVPATDAWCHAKDLRGGRRRPPRREDATSEIRVYNAIRHTYPRRDFTPSIRRPRSNEFSNASASVELREKGAALETPWRESVDTRATCRGRRNMTAPGAISATWYCSSQPCGLYRCHRRRRRCRHSLFFCSTCCRRCRSVTAGRQAGGRRVLRDLVARRKGQAGLGGCRAPVFSRRR